MIKSIECVYFSSGHPYEFKYNMMISMITIHNFRNLPHKMQQAFLYEEYILFVHLTMLETTDLVRSDTATINQGPLKQMDGIAINGVNIR